MVKNSYQKIAFTLAMSSFIIIAMIIFNSLTTTRFNKQIMITIKDEQQKVIFNQAVIVNDDTLDSVLLKLANEGDIKYEYGGSEAGTKIIGLGTDVLLKENTEQKTVWTYTSPNNVHCLEKGVCDTVDKLLINDGDEFVFTLIHQE